MPSNEAIGAVNKEAARIATQRVLDFVKPRGTLIGRPGDAADVRMVPGGQQAAVNAYNYLTVGGAPYTGSYPGTMVVLPGGIYVGIRTNRDGLPTVDVNLPDKLGSVRFHYE